MPASAADQVITVFARSARNYRSHPYPMNEPMLRTHDDVIGTMLRLRTELLIPAVLIDSVKRIVLGPCGSLRLRHPGVSGHVVCT